MRHLLNSLIDLLENFLLLYSLLLLYHRIPFFKLLYSTRVNDWDGFFSLYFFVMSFSSYEFESYIYYIYLLPENLYCFTCRNMCINLKCYGNQLTSINNGCHLIFLIVKLDDVAICRNLVYLVMVPDFARSTDNWRSVYI